MPRPEDAHPNADAPLVLDEDALEQVRGGTGTRTQGGDFVFTKNVDKSTRVLSTQGPSQPPPPPKPAT